MPNLFSKISSQSGTINLFSGGKQLKSLIILIDVVRCIKFMEENIKIKKKSFTWLRANNCKKIAELCKKINPKINLVTTKR